MNPIPWTTLGVGTGRITHTGQQIRLAIGPTQPDAYSNAQIYDYARLKRPAYPNHPPVRLSLRAWASHSVIQGTAGFGFWNQPFVPGERLPRLPRYAWFFFAGPPMNMSFGLGVPGHGAKAATADFSRWGFLSLLPGAPLGFLLMRIPALYRRLWPLAQRAIGASECVLGGPTMDFDLRKPHDYQLDWLEDSVRWYVDGNLVLRSPYSPCGPLGLVVWVDNQYAIITPQGQLGGGLLGVAHEQWLTVEGMTLHRRGEFSE